MATYNYHCRSSKDLISDVMRSESEDSEDNDEDVVIVEGDITDMDMDSDSECERQSHSVHVLPAHVNRVQQSCADTSLDSSYLSSSSSSTVTVDSNPSSLMSRLRRPTTSELSRKCLIDHVPPKGKKRCKGSSSNDPKSVTPQQRVKR